MRHLTAQQKEAARKELAMYLGNPPYGVDEARRLIASGLLDRGIAAKYGVTPIELIREISAIELTAEQREEALLDLTRIFGRLSVSGAEVRRKRSSGAVERQILGKYLHSIRELADAVGFREKRGTGLCRRPKGATDRARRPGRDTTD